MTEFGSVRRRGRPSWLALAVLIPILCGCSWLPTQGPYPGAVVGSRSASPDKVQYIVADLTPGILARIRDDAKSDFGGRFRDGQGTPHYRLGVGDQLNITIFEAAAGGLFIPLEAGVRPGNFVTLPMQEIAEDGTVEVPYAGRIRAAGRSAGDVKHEIERRLQNRAIEPQAVVSLQEARSAQVSVSGEVTTSTRYILSKSGERILDAIARAGGLKYPVFETYVSLQRGSLRGKVYFNKIVSDPTNNVFLKPGDTIVVSREFRSFMALGASGQNGQINFDSEALTLAQAMGRAGGILDVRGDPAQTFLYRTESRQVMAELGYDVTPFSAPTIPVIYRVNFREPDGLILAGQFAMRDGDIVFVSNAPAAEFAKLVGTLGLAATTAVGANTGAIIAR